MDDFDPCRRNHQQQAHPCCGFRDGSHGYQSYEHSTPNLFDRLIRKRLRLQLCFSKGLNTQVITKNVDAVAVALTGLYPGMIATQNVPSQGSHASEIDGSGASVCRFDSGLARLTVCLDLYKSAFRNRNIHVPGVATQAIVATGSGIPIVCDAATSGVCFNPGPRSIEDIDRPIYRLHVDMTVANRCQRDGAMLTGFAKRYLADRRCGFGSRR